MTERALELLNLSPSNNTDLLILDIGCGSGISGSVLSEYGHHWVGMDISRAMLGKKRIYSDFCFLKIFILSL